MTWHLDILMLEEWNRPDPGVLQNGVISIACEAEVMLIDPERERTADSVCWYHDARLGQRSTPPSRSSSE